MFMIYPVCGLEDRPTVISNGVVRLFKLIYIKICGVKVLKNCTGTVVSFVTDEKTTRK